MKVKARTVDISFALTLTQMTSFLMHFIIQIFAVLLTSGTTGELFWGKVIFFWGGISLLRPTALICTWFRTLNASLHIQTHEVGQ